jgi:nucleoside 2-deoxyribosyltransferase
MREPGHVDYFEAMKRAAAASRHNIALVRIDLKEGDYEISSEIMAEINKADFVIADFTLSSSNVYFELGCARGVGKPIVQSCRKGTTLEFDVRSWRTVFYRNATDLEQKLIASFDALVSS